MALTVSKPWILGYLTEVAESQGGNLGSVGPFAKGKRVQLIKFLTQQESSTNLWIWAVVSDKVHSIPVRFSKEAVRACMSRPEHAAHDVFSFFRTALITIKVFRPMFSRIPYGGKLTSIERIALEVNEVSINGSFDEETWGKPKDIETVGDIKLWCEGLMDPHGGGGNILKQRKQQQQLEMPDAAKPQSNSTKQTSLHLQKVIKPPSRTGPPRAAKKGTVSGPVVPVLPVRKDPHRECNKKWKRIVEDPTRYLPSSHLLRVDVLRSRSPSPVPHRSASKLPVQRMKGKNIFDPDSSPARTPGHTELREVESLRGQATPSHWSPSPPPRRKRRATVLESETEEEHPTPAQRPKRPPPTPTPSTKPNEPEQILPSHVAGSPLKSVKPSVFVLVPRNRRKKSPFKPFNPGVILVPNSDSSQSQNRTQSLPGFPSQPEQLPKSSQFLSYASDSGVHYGSSQPEQRWSSQLQKLADPVPSSIITSSLIPQPPDSAGHKSLPPRTSKEKTPNPHLPIPYSQLTIESWPTSELRPTKKVARPEPSSIESADSPLKSKASKNKLDDIQSDTESEPDEIQSHANNSNTRVNGAGNNSIDAYADDEAASHNSSESPFDSRALGEEPEYVDEDVKNEERDASDDALESDDARMDAIFGRAEAEDVQSRISLKPRRPVHGQRRSSAHSYSSEVPILPTSPDVFLSKTWADKAVTATRNTSRAPSRISVQAYSPPPGRSNKRQTPPVFDAGVSSNPSSVQNKGTLANVAPSTNHDVDVWRAPAFLQERWIQETSFATKPTRAKRPASKSPSVATTEPSTKKRRIDADSASVARSPQPRSSHNPGSTNSGATKEIDFGSSLRVRSVSRASIIPQGADSSEMPYEAWDFCNRIILRASRTMKLTREPRRTRATLK